MGERINDFERRNALVEALKSKPPDNQSLYARAMLIAGRNREMLQPDEMICPQCGEIARSDSVDIGVGIQVRGNFYCEACHWAKPTDEAPLDLDAFLEDDRP